MNPQFFIDEECKFIPLYHNSYRFSCHRIFKILFFIDWKILIRAFKTLWLWVKKLTSQFLLSFPHSFLLPSFTSFSFIWTPTPNLHSTKWSMPNLGMSKWNDNERVCLTCPAELTALFGSSLFSAWRLCFFIDCNCSDLLLSSIILNSLSHLSVTHLEIVLISIL